MSQALVGLIGVIVGTAIAGGFQYALRRRTDTSESRVAARLLGEALLNRHVPTPKDSSLPEVYDFEWIADEWREHRAVLARSLTWQQWSVVAEAVNRASSLSGQRIGEVAPGGAPAEEYDGAISQLEAGVLDLVERELYVALLSIQRAAFGRRYAREVLQEAQEEGLLDDISARLLGLSPSKAEPEA
jgi:hypothetical protein